MSPLNKVVAGPDEAVAGIASAMSVHIGGWGGIGVPEQLILALKRLGSTNLTITTNNCGQGDPGDVGELFDADLVSKVITTFPVSVNAAAFKRAIETNRTEVELVPQGTLAERLRAAGAGIGAFYTPTSVGTPLAGDREIRRFGDREQVLELALSADFALIRAWQADSFGNLRFRYAARGYNPLMAMAAKVAVVQADHLVPLGAIAPDDIHLPGVFVDRVFPMEVSQ